MDEKPAVKPVLEPDLEVEHSALVAPRLDFIHAAAVPLRHAQFRKPKRVLGKATVVHAHAITAARAKVRKDLPVDEFHEDLLRGGIGRKGGLRRWLGRSRFCSRWRGRLGRC